MTYGHRARTAQRIKQMTIKEIAKAVGKDDRSVRRWAAKLSGNMSNIQDKLSNALKTKEPADFDFDETMAIIEKGMGKNAAYMFRQNAESRQPVSGGIDYDKLAQVVAVAVATAISATRSPEKPQQLQLEAPKKTTRAELNQLVRKYATNVLAGDFSAAWRNLYSEILYRLSRNITLCAKNSRMSPIEYLEQENLLEPSCLIVVELLGEGNV